MRARFRADADVRSLGCAARRSSGTGTAWLDRSHVGGVELDLYLHACVPWLLPLENPSHEHAGPAHV